MSEVAELSTFFEAPEPDLQAFEAFADQIFVSAKEVERFDALLAAQRQAGADAGRVGIGLLLLGRYNEALETFAKAKDTKFRRYYAAEAALALGRYDDAIREFQAAAKQGWDALDVDMRIAEAHVRARELDAARGLVKKRSHDGQDRAEWWYASGLIVDQEHDRDTALSHYEKALKLNPDHIQAMYRAAWLYDLRGDDDEAINLYEILAGQPRAHVNALINLAVVYEDRGKFSQAKAALHRVLSAYPNHARARLFMKDVESSAQMVIDEGDEKRTEKRNRLLETPISEFELSVRARNCLKKMRIQNLADLLRLREEELLSYKNFGETSLTEIRALLNKYGLSLGQNPDEIDPATLVEVVKPAPQINVPPGNEALLAKPVSELELTVRARRCLQRLNISSIRDLVSHTEADLLAMRNFGVTSLNEIKGRLTELGLSLASKR